MSSVTFGMGHIVNLFNGSGAKLVSNLCQVKYAIVVITLSYAVYLLKKVSCFLFRNLPLCLSLYERCAGEIGRAHV